MNYEDALRLWGASKLATKYKHTLLLGGEQTININTVVVTMDFDEGDPCCGGTDPNCYCSMATSPSANVVISGRTDCNTYMWCNISVDDFDFATVLREIVAVGDGTLTMEGGNE